MKKTLVGSWIVTIVATLGSLSFSELFNFIPCTFCWYQRILMYPLVIILGIAVYEQNDRIYKYVLPFSVVGMLVSGYHYALQKYLHYKRLKHVQAVYLARVSTLTGLALSQFHF